MSKVYSFGSYDKNLSLKLNFFTWLAIVYFMRSLILKISTIQMGRGGVKTKSVQGLRDLVYPDDFSIFLGYLVIVPVLVVVIAYVKRKPEASDLIRKLWGKGRMLLIGAAVMEIGIIFLRLLVDPGQVLSAIDWIQLAIAALIIGYLSISKRVADTFADFPKKEVSSPNNK